MKPARIQLRIVQNDEPDRAEVLTVIFSINRLHDLESRSVGTGNPITQLQRPDPGGQSPVPSESRHAGRTALCPAMSVAPAAVPQPRLFRPPEFWWVGPLFGVSRHVNFCWALGVGWWAAGDSNSGPLIKSQSQRGPEPNIDKKTQPFRSSLGFFFDN
jgi:hypothetical protein